MTEQTFVVAGNASSLADDKSGRILASDQILRVNNFFFEPQSYLGPRVDLAVMGGDHRVAPFMFEGLWRQRQVYDLRRWTSHNPQVIRAGQRRFGASFTPFPEAEGHARPALQAEVEQLMAEHGCKPMTGTYAALCAYRMGAQRIILTGFDFYQSAKRYTYDAGSRQAGLLGPDLNTRGVDARLHNISLDLAILERIQQEMDGQLFRISSNSLLDGFADLAPLREGPALDVRPTNPPDDWPAWAGLYPLAALRVMRAVRGEMRKWSRS